MCFSWFYDFHGHFLAFSLGFITFLILVPTQTHLVIHNRENPTLALNIPEHHLPVNNDNFSSYRIEITSPIISKIEINKFSAVCDDAMTSSKSGTIKDVGYKSYHAPHCLITSSYFWYICWPEITKVNMSNQQGDLGFMYLDLYSRKGKYPGCAHFAIRGGRRLSDTNYQLPVYPLNLVLVIVYFCSKTMNIKAFSHKGVTSQIPYHLMELN